jgi:anti-sigma factor RsiW
MTSTCVDLVNLLIDYVDGDLPADRRDEFKRHMCGCLPCYVYLQTYQDTIRMTRSLPKCEMPPEMAARLQSMLYAEAAGHSGG